VYVIRAKKKTYIVSHRSPEKSWHENSVIDNLVPPPLVFVFDSHPSPGALRVGLTIALAALAKLDSFAYGVSARAAQIACTPRKTSGRCHSS